jgi:hypothetical protein
MNVAIQPVSTRSSTARMTAAVLTLLGGAIAPVLLAIALLASVALHRPFLARYLEPRAQGADRTAGLARRITVIWGIGLLVIGGLQAVFSTTFNVSLLGPVDILVRTLGALALEAVLLTGTAVYVRGRR